MRVRTYALAVAIVAFFTISGVPAFGQASQLEGAIVTVGADGKEVAVPDAQIDIYRTDIKSGKWNLKADKRGRFLMLGIPFNATVTVIVSGSGLNGTYLNGVRLADQKPLKFVMRAGSGNRPTLEDATTNRSTAATPTTPTSNKMSDEEAAKLEAERTRIAEENAKIEAARSLFDEKKAHFDTGVAAMTADNVEAAIPALTSALEGLDTADQAIFGEMIHKSASNLAEAQYRVGVVHYNKNERDRAKQLLEASYKNINRAVSIAPDDLTYYQIQAKTGELLVAKWNQSDKAETTAKAYSRLAENEADAKQKLALQLKTAEAYRLGFVAESNTTYDEAKVKAFQSKAVAGFKAVLATEPKQADAIYGIALTYAGSGEKADWQQAANYYKLFVDAAPGDSRATAAKGQLTVYEKDYKIRPQPIK